MSTFSEWAPVVAWRKSFGRIPAARSVKIEESREYADAREEARQMARNLGLDISNEHWDQASIADFLRLCYAQGWQAHEKQMMSPDRADEIALAIQYPEKVIGTSPSFIGSTKLHWQVRAVQQAAVHGVSKR